MVFDKMLANCSDFKWSGFSYFRSHSKYRPFANQLCYTIQNTDMSNFRSPPDSFLSAALRENSSPVLINQSCPWCQGTVVLGKNVRLLLHSFGRAQDQIPLPTQKNPALALRSKREEFGIWETKQERPPANDH